MASERADQDLLTTAAAAERLGVTTRRVCQLVARGALPTVQVGGSALIPAGAVASRLEAGTPTGRPWDARTTWAVVWLVEGREPGWVHERTLRRLRHIAAAIGPEELHRRVERLVTRTSWTASPETAAAISREPGLLRHPSSPEVWLPESRAAGLAARYGLSPGSDLVVVAVECMWPFGPSDAVLPGCLVHSGC